MIFNDGGKLSAHGCDGCGGPKGFITPPFLIISYSLFFLRVLFFRASQTSSNLYNKVITPAILNKYY